MFTAWTICGAAAVLLAVTAAQHRRHAAATDLRLCRGCATPCPTPARFCRRCGRTV